MADEENKNRPSQEEIDKELDSFLNSIMGAKAEKAEAKKEATQKKELAGEAEGAADDEPIFAVVNDIDTSAVAQHEKKLAESRASKVIDDLATTYEELPDEDEDTTELEMQLALIDDGEDEPREESAGKTDASFQVDINDFKFNDVVDEAKGSAHADKANGTDDASDEESRESADETQDASKAEKPKGDGGRNRKNTGNRRRNKAEEDKGDKQPQKGTGGKKDKEPNAAVETLKRVLASPSSFFAVILVIAFALFGLGQCSKPAAPEEPQQKPVEEMTIAEKLDGEALTEDEKEELKADTETEVLERYMNSPLVYEAQMAGEKNPWQREERPLGLDITEMREWDEAHPSQPTEEQLAGYFEIDTLSYSQLMTRLNADDLPPYTVIISIDEHFAPQDLKNRKYTALNDFTIDNLRGEWEFTVNENGNLSDEDIKEIARHIVEQADNGYTLWISDIEGETYAPAIAAAAMHFYGHGGSMARNYPEIHQDTYARLLPEIEACIGYAEAKERGEEVENPDKKNPYEETIERGGILGGLINGGE